MLFICAARVAIRVRSSPPNGTPKMQEESQLAMRAVAGVTQATSPQN